MNLSFHFRMLITLGLLTVMPGMFAADGSLKKDLTFYASFDKGTDANLSKGDKRLYTLVDKQSKVGNHTDNMTRLAKGKGVIGDALLFTKRNAKWLFYDGAKNFEFKKKDWSGTLSFWMKVDPINELDPGYVDPIQVTPFTWNNASFFVDFDKGGNPRSFRLGAFADKPVWNPENKDVPESQRPLVQAKSNPFSKEKWTHVAFTWERFNTGKKDGMSTLYLNGKKEGSITGWNQQFSWADKPHRILIGLNYMGLFDDLACFNRALSEKELHSIYTDKSALANLLN
ncbi:MAG: LamG-like jellyroll fold domain-containing protein [Verrucomicrobiota bacterium]|nr:LamG-like jellyroll fold domain-containing protein [Verrucomicrobiota bacterium]